MELYEKSDLDLIDKNIDDIVIRIEDIKKDMFGEPHKKPENTAQKSTQPEPNIEDVNKIVAIVLNFIKQKKRKIYGGYALNKIISHKNPKDAFYEKGDVPDIDVYSPDPIKDLVELCDTLSKEYPDVIGKEAIHEETYKIFTKGYNAIDLSYVPFNVFNNIPFVELDGIRYVHPNFAMIDLYKMVTEPLFSSFRWKKIIPRLYTLQKHFPFNKVSKPVPNVYVHKNDINDMLNVIFDFIKDNKDVYLIGEFAYNQFLKESKIKKQNFSEIDVPFYKIVSVNYAPTVKKIVELLKEKNYKVDVKEYYPLWSLTDYSVEIFCNNEIVAKIYKYQKRCTPIKNINVNDSFVQIGCFDYVLLTELISAFRMKVINDSTKKDYHNVIVSHLVEMRNYYLKQTNKTLLDDTLFQSLATSCIGPTVNPMEEAYEKRKEKKKQGKSMMFMYKPVRKLEHKWIFANTSGNEINNPKNLKIHLK